MSSAEGAGWRASPGIRRRQAGATVTCNVRGRGRGEGNPLRSSATRAAAERSRSGLSVGGRDPPHGERSSGGAAREEN